jgi:beta-lactamase class A
MKERNSMRLTVFMVGTIGFLAGVAVCVGAYLSFLHPTAQAQIGPLRESDLTHQREYTYIDPLIGLKNTGTVDSPSYNELKQSVQSLLDQNTQAGKINVASVLFSDISQSAGFTLNADEEYNPASLLKVPTMMAYYQLAETNPNILSQRLTYNSSTDEDLQENIVSPIQLKKGETYSVEELIEHMIKYSDNNAATMLVNNLNDIGHPDAFNSLFQQMGINQIDLNSDYITIRAYSLFFRVLYNSTYLSRDMSERAMDLLTQTDFSKGIEAGVPNNTEVAQKFGEFTLEDQHGNVVERELHNCGIVYYPDHPYLLCVMTKGGNFTDLEGVISEVSKTVYQYMEKNY